MNNKLKLTLIASAAFYGAGAFAAPAIGFKTGAADPDFAFADLWTNETDSALSVGFDPTVIIPPSAPYETQLIAQARVGGMSNGGSVLGSAAIGCELNVDCQITKVLKFNELVTFNDGTNANFDLGTNNPGPELQIYFNNAVTADPNGATGYQDGTLILEADILSATASFASSGPSLGTGSFDLRFMITFANNDFIDVATNTIIGDVITGTTNVPPFFNPTVMWDGTNTGDQGNILLKVDSSESFVQGVPEPATLALFGLGLLGMGGFAQRKNKVSE